MIKPTGIDVFWVIFLQLLILTQIIQSNQDESKVPFKYLNYLQCQRTRLKSRWDAFVCIYHSSRVSCLKSKTSIGCWCHPSFWCLSSSSEFSTICASTCFFLNTARNIIHHDLFPKLWICLKIWCSNFIFSIQHCIWANQPFHLIHVSFPQESRKCVPFKT